MAKNGKQKAKENSLKLKIETKQGILSVIFFVLAIFFLMSALKIAGVAGEFFYEKLHFLLGVGYILLPALFALLGISYLKSRVPNIGWMRFASSVIFLLSSLGIIDILSKTHAGGILGEILPAPLVSLFDVYASVVFLLAMLTISILVIFDTRFNLAPFKNFVMRFKRKESSEIQETVLTEPPVSPLSGGESTEEFTTSPDKGKLRSEEHT